MAPGHGDSSLGSGTRRTGDGSRRLTYHPLDPDDVVGVGLRAEVLEATAEVVPHPLALLTQVGLRFRQKVLRHVHHVHRPEERQEQPLGDPANAGAAVQGAGGPRRVGAFLKQDRRQEGSESQRDPVTAQGHASQPEGLI